MTDMKEGYICGTCGKKLKNGAGLAGHKMLAHPIVRDQDNGNPPEEALAEISNDVKRSIERLERRLEDSESHARELQGQLHTANGRFDDLRESMLERLQEETEARAKAESAAQAAHQELTKWQEGQLHHQLRSLWDQAENCEDCARDKAAIVAELAAQSRPEALEAAQEADGSASEQAAQAGTDGGPGASRRSLLDANSEAAVSNSDSASEQVAKVKRFRVDKEAFLAFLDKDYQLLPDGTEEPRVGDETEDEVLVGHWRRAGYGVEELGKPSDDTPNEPIRFEPGWLDRIFGERE